MFGALILGKYNNETLEYIGHTGTGFNDKTLKDVHKKMQPLITDKSPLSGKIKGNMPATWLKPELVCEVKYSEKTKDGILRHPVFLGIMEDKKAKQEKNEVIVDPAEIEFDSKKFLKLSTPIKKEA